MVKRKSKPKKVRVEADLMERLEELVEKTDISLWEQGEGEHHSFIFNNYEDDCYARKCITVTHEPNSDVDRSNSARVEYRTVDKIITLQGAYVHDIIYMPLWGKHLKAEEKQTTKIEISRLILG